MEKPCIYIYYRQHTHYLKSNTGWLSAIFCRWNVSFKCPAIISCILRLSGNNQLHTTTVRQQSAAYYDCPATISCILRLSDNNQLHTTTVRQQSAAYYDCTATIICILRLSGNNQLHTTTVRQQSAAYYDSTRLGTAFPWWKCPDEIALGAHRSLPEIFQEKVTF